MAENNGVPQIHEGAVDERLVIEPRRPFHHYDASYVDVARAYYLAGRAEDGSSSEGVAIVSNNGTIVCFGRQPSGSEIARAVRAEHRRRSQPI